MNTEEAKRLAFVLYLLRSGEDQAQAAPPRCWTAVLTLHDAAELALQVAAEHVGADVPRNAGFLQYWGLISDAIAPEVVPLREAMSRLNKARVGLKHYGNLPDRQQVREFALSTGSFVEAICRLVFGVDARSLSLVDFISVHHVREHLKRAQAHLAEGSCARALEQVALAMETLVQSVVVGGEHPQGSASPLDFSPDLRTPYGEAGAPIREDDPVRTALQRMAGVVQVLALGIDYTGYLHLRRLCPVVLRRPDTAAADYLWFRPEATVTPAEVAWGLDYVAECALGVQERCSMFLQEPPGDLGEP